jgi:hypothetical protein
MGMEEGDVVEIKNNVVRNIGELTTLTDSASLYLLLKTDTRANSEQLRKQILALPGVEELCMTSGEWSFIVKCTFH